MIRLSRPSSDDALHDLVPDFMPLLDILFILLVFFMLTAGMAFQVFDLKLPSAATQTLSSMDEGEYLVLEIREDGYVLDGTVIETFTRLKAATPGVIEEKPERGLIIAGDKRVTIERFIKVLTYLQSQGVEAANVLMKRQEEPS